MKQQEAPWVDLSVTEGQRDVTAAAAVGTGFGRGGWAGSTYELADGWATVRGVQEELDETAPPGGYSGVVNEPTYTYPDPDDIKTLEEVHLTAATLKYATVEEAGRDLASTDLDTTPMQRVRPKAYTGLMAKFMQLQAGLPLEYEGTPRTVSAEFSVASSHGIVKAGGDFWHVQITTSGVSACRVPLLGLPTSALRKLKKKGKAAGTKETDPVARCVGLFGDLPLYTGSPPSYDPLLTFPSGAFSRLHPSVPWAFNMAGTEARCIAIARQNTSLSSPLCGVHVLLTFDYDEIDEELTVTYEEVDVTPVFGTAPYASTDNVLMFDARVTNAWKAPNTISTWLATEPLRPTLPSATMTDVPMYVYYDAADTPRFAMQDKTTYPGFSLLCTSQEQDGPDWPPPKPGSASVVWTTFTPYGFFDSSTDWQPTEIAFTLFSGSGRPSVWKAVGTLDRNWLSGTITGTMSQDITSNFAALGPGATDTTVGSATETITVGTGSQVSQRALIVPRGASDRVAVLESVSPSGTVVNTWAFSTARVVSSGIVTDSSTVSRVFTCNEDGGLRLKVFGGTAVHEIPVTITGVLSSWSMSGSKSDSGTPPGNFLPYALPSAFTKLRDYLAGAADRLTSPDIVVESATRTARRVRLSAIELELTGSDPLILTNWTVTPTYEDGASPAAAAVDLNTADGQFSFFGDY